MTSAPGRSVAAIEPVCTCPKRSRRSTGRSSQCRSKSYSAAPESSSVATAVEVRVGAGVEVLDGHAAVGDLPAAAQAVGVVAERRGEDGVVAEAGDAHRDVGRGPADVLGDRPVGGVHDVDEGLADDEDLLGVRLGAHLRRRPAGAPPCGRARGGSR